MKKLLTLLAALIVALAMTLLAGCGSGNDNSVSPDTTNSNNYTIGVYNSDGPIPGALQEIDCSYDGTSWTAYPGMLYFELVLAGRGKGGIDLPADFVLYKNDEPINYDNPAADLAAFKKVKILEEKTSHEYNFITTGRYMVKTFYTNTNTEITHIRLTVVSPPVPD